MVTLNCEHTHLQPKHAYTHPNATNKTRILKLYTMLSTKRMVRPNARILVTRVCRTDKWIKVGVNEQTNGLWPKVVAIQF